MLEEVTTEFIFKFMLIFARLGTAFMLFPALGDHNVFMRGRLAIAVLVTFVLYPLILSSLPTYSENLLYNVSLLFIEVVIGLIITIGAKCYFLSLHTIGQIISMQSGLGAATFFDPGQRSQVAIFGNLLIISTTVYIFITDTHYLFIQAILDSYTRFPPGELLEISDMSKFVTHVVNDSFILAFKISSPFLLLGMVLLVGAGILSRLMPNLQVFFILTPAQVLLMFAILYLVMETLVEKIIIAVQMTLGLTSF